MYCLKNKKKTINSPFLLIKNMYHKQILLFLIMLVLPLFMSFNVEAALFSELTQSGSKIFEGMRTIIYAVAGFGIVGIAIGGFFGNLNWKWLSAVIIGLLVIAMTAGILSYMTESNLEENSITIQDSLKNAN